MKMNTSTMKESIVILLLLLSFSCQDDDVTDSNPRTGLLLDNRIESGGVEREYHLFVPENHVNAPLVLLLHGNGSSHDDVIGEGNVKAPHEVWLSLATQNDFMVLVPNGTTGSNNKRGWNDCRTDAMGSPNADDVGFLADLLTRVKSDYDYDVRKVYVAGTSNGGHMAFRLAQDIPDRITAFASIIASVAENSECANSSVPVSALFMNGTEDGIMPYEGGEMASNRGVVWSTDQSVNYWSVRNGTDVTPIVEDFPDNNTRDGSTATKYLYQNGANDTEVALYEITDGGHTEPSIRERYSNLFLLVVGRQNGDFEMAEEIWDFFKDKSK